MNSIIGVWKMKYMLVPGEKGIEKKPMDDPESERMRFVFNEDGTVYEGIQSPGKLSAKDKAYMAKQGYQLIGDVIVTKTKSWKEENGRLFSEISSQIASEDELKDMGEIFLEGEYLKIWAMFTFCLLEKVA